MVAKYNPPTFVNDSETGPYLDDAYFNNLGAALKRSLDAVDVLESGEFYHNFRNKPNGLLEYADSGQQFISRPVASSGQFVVPTVTGGMVGFPPGTSLSAGACYTMCQLPKVPTRIYGTFRFDASDGGNTSIAALGAFTNTSMASSSVVVRTPVHLSIGPKSAVFQVASGPGDFPQVMPTGHTSFQLVYPYPLKTDGITEYEAEIYIDSKANKAYCRIADFPVWEFQDWRIGITEAVYPFWETFVFQSTQGYCGFTSIGADTRPLQNGLNAIRGLVRAKPGAGPAHLRPPSRFQGGNTWYDSTLNKLLYSDTVDWKDFVGNKSGNLYADNVVIPSVDVNAIGVSNAARERRTTPPKFKAPLAVLARSSGNGLIQVFPIITYGNVVVPGQTYSAMIGELIGLTNTRSAVLRVSYFDSNFTQLSTVDSPSFTIPATMPEGGPVNSAIVTTTAPAGASLLFMVLDIQNTVAGDEFLLTRFCVAPGTITGFVHR